MKECAVDAAAGMHVQDLDPEVPWNDMHLTQLVDLKIGNHGALYPSGPRDWFSVPEPYAPTHCRDTSVRRSDESLLLDDTWRQSVDGMLG
jgi:hypothetical protein